MVRCEGLTKRYGNIVALDKLNLTIRDRTIFGFLGPNGAGKTTTLKILTGLSRPTNGKAWVAGVEVAPNSMPLQSKIGYLPEEPSFYNWMTGREFLTFVGELFRLPPKEIKNRSSELLELVDLTQAASRRVGGYSRGMRQRLGIAQALMNKPAVLFLDEPCSALDPIGRAEVLETLIRLKGQDTTIFMSSHILADVERVCDFIGIIDKGRIIVESGVEELRKRFARPVLELEFEEPASHFVETIDSLPWVERVEVEAGEQVFRVRVSISDVERAKKEVPKMVAESGLALRRYELVLPTLEEVFIELFSKKEN
ncbi:MAG: ABC transporter ATP-binding protein [Dehalococcoidia bacterium]|nr:ABC transporter ATP-binding protein [Dehalococcoidia bacterium]